MGSGEGSPALAPFDAEATPSLFNLYSSRYFLTLTYAFQTSKVIVIQNGHQIRIRDDELVLGKLWISKLNVKVFIKLKITISKLYICLLMPPVPASPSAAPY